MWARVLQAIGLVALVLSLAAYWVLGLRSPEGASAPALAAPRLATSQGEMPEFSLVLAGRDVKYCKPGYGPGKLRAVACTGPERLSERTDTILYLRVGKNQTDVLSIPRDTVVEHDGIFHKVNTSYRYGGPLGLKTALEQLTGQSVDYYAIVNIEFAAAMIDALGGVNVYIPQAMKYDDYAGGLHIDIPQGNQLLKGDDAIGYLRIRKGYGDDYARMDRAKTVIQKLLEKLKSPAIVAAVPTLLSGLSSDVETNMDLGFIQSLLPFAKQIKPHFSTLPTLEPSAAERYRLAGLGDFLVADQAAIAERFQAASNPSLPATGDLYSQRQKLQPVLIINGTGVTGFARALAKHLALLGFPTATVQSAPASDDLTQVLRQAQSDQASADAYAEFLGLPVFTPHQLLDAPLVIHLGRDAALRYAGLVEVAQAIATAGDTPEAPAVVETPTP
jgi:polyisoprenyl-teichoic acid--peptidoglycan teichoic acid transferase